MTLRGSHVKARRVLIILVCVQIQNTSVKLMTMREFQTGTLVPLKKESKKASGEARIILKGNVLKVIAPNHLEAMKLLTSFKQRKR